VKFRDEPPHARCRGVACLLPFMCVLALIAIFWMRNFSVFHGLRL
jgi:hypothetical protein